MERYPVSFGDPIDVEAVTLGSYAARSGLAAVDFIWASIQDAERDMIRGAQRLLRTTRYLYTDFSDDGTYEGQPSLSEIVGLLPDFRVLELCRDHVLLENQGLAR